MNNRLGLYRAGIIVGLLVLILGAIFVATQAMQQQATEEAQGTQHAPDAAGGHDHNNDGKPDH